MGKYKFRAGCSVHSQDEQHYIIDNLRQISIPINKCAADLLTSMPDNLTQLEMSLLDKLYSLGILVTEEEHITSRRILQDFYQPLVCVPHNTLYRQEKVM